MKKLFYLCSLCFLLLIQLEAATLKVNTRDFTSEPTQRRRTTLTLLSTGPLVSGPWLIAGDSVSKFTDTNGIAYYSNVLAANYRLDIAGAPGRSFPLAIADTNGIVNAADVVNSTNANASYYTAAQVDALIAGVEGGSGTAVNASGLATTATNSGVVTVTVSATEVGAVLSSNALRSVIATNGPDGQGLTIGALSGLAASVAGSQFTSLIGNSNGYNGSFTGSGLNLTNVPGTSITGSLTNNTTGNAATATTAANIAAGATLNPVNLFNGTNLNWGAVSTYNGDGSNAWPFTIVNVSNAPPQLLTRSAQMSGGGEQSIQSWGNKWKGISPKGVNTYNLWGAEYANYNESNILRLIRIMNTNGMVRNGYNWLLVDEGVGFLQTTNYATAYPSRLWQADTNRFPNGFKYIVDYAHTNNVKIMLYTLATGLGPAGYWCVGGSNSVDLVNNLSNIVNYMGVDGIKFEAGFDGPAHIAANAVASFGKPIWMNVAADENNTKAMFADTVNSWRTGVALYGDVTTNGILWNWIDRASFQLTRPGHVNNFDIFQAGYAFNETQSGHDFLVRNSQAIAAMANSEMLLANTPSVEQFQQRSWYFYDDYNNPLINAIHADFTKPVWLQASNHLAVTHAKILAEGGITDGGVAVLVMNRSTTNKTETISFKDYFGNYDSSQTLSTNPLICTVRDVRKNVTLGYYTNSYSASIVASNNAWLVIHKGIREQYSPGTNYLSDFAPSSFTNTYNDPGISWNYNYTPGIAGGKVTINSVAYDKSILVPVSFGSIRYPIHGQADSFSMTVQHVTADLGSGQVLLLTNDVLAATYTVANNGITNITLALGSSINWLTMVYSNGVDTSTTWRVGNPAIYCQKQTYLDPNGYQVWRLDPERPLYGSGSLLTNIGEAFIPFETCSVETFTRLTSASSSATPLFLFNGLTAAGSVTARFVLPLPNWATNVTLSSLISCEGVSTWTNLVEPLYYSATEGRIYNAGGINISNEVFTIGAANTYSNWTTTITFPATNVFKAVRISFNTASNTANRAIGPQIKATYR